MLTRQKIAAAALAVIDREGLAALSMRAVGRELGVAAMSLYNHVADRAALESLVAEAIVSGIEVTPCEADPLDEARRLMVALREALTSHPEAIPLALTRPTGSEAALTPIEALLAALSRAGLDGTRVLLAYRTLFGFLLGFVQSDLTSPVSSGQPATLSRVVGGLAQLPEDRFPQLHACAAVAVDSSSDAEFAYGLDIILRGILDHDQDSQSGTSPSPPS